MTRVILTVGVLRYFLVMNALVKWSLSLTLAYCFLKSPLSESLAACSFTGELTLQQK